MKHIMLNNKQLASNLKDILSQLKLKGQVSLSELYEVNDRVKRNMHPVITITEKAYTKMQQLVDECNVEIAWHNTVSRNNFVFTVHDTLCYPQITGPVTVEADEGYTAWQEQLDDKTYNSMRMQGHSHVNMGVSPSGTDEDYYSTLLEHVKTYYIFLIMNKRGATYARIYDYTNNIMFENDDIEIIVPKTIKKTWAQQQMDNYVTTTSASKLLSTGPPWGTHY